MEIGQVVKTQDGEFGWVRHVKGDSVIVEPLPDFARPDGVAWPVHPAATLETAKVCGCATLGQRRDGQVFTTGCDFSRTPKGSFLPGHDARAKAFLIKAWGYGPLFGGHAHALDAARQFSDKIAARVAEGIDRARVRDQKRATSKQWRQQVQHEDVPATREDQLTAPQQLHREHGITQAMLRVLVRGALNDTPGYRGSVAGPAGTEVALMKRGLTSWGRVTDRGYAACGLPTFADEHPDRVQCTDAQGSYEDHAPRYDDETFVRVCKRCGKTADDC